MKGYGLTRPITRLTKATALSNYRDNGMRQTNRDSLDNNTANEEVFRIRVRVRYDMERRHSDAYFGTLSDIQDYTCATFMQFTHNTFRLALVKLI